MNTRGPTNTCGPWKPWTATHAWAGATLTTRAATARRKPNLRRVICPSSHPTHASDGRVRSPVACALLFRKNAKAALHRQNDAKLRLPAHHARVGFIHSRQRILFDHGPHAGQFRLRACTRILTSPAPGCDQKSPTRAGQVSTPGTSSAHLLLLPLPLCIGQAPATAEPFVELHVRDETVEADLRERVLRRVELLLGFEHFEVIGQPLAIAIGRMLHGLREGL